MKPYRQRHHHRHCLHHQKTWAWLELPEIKYFGWFLNKILKELFFPNFGNTLCKLFFWDFGKGALSSGPLSLSSELSGRFSLGIFDTVCSPSSAMFTLSKLFFSQKVVQYFKRLRSQITSTTCLENFSQRQCLRKGPKSLHFVLGLD